MCKTEKKNPGLGILEYKVTTCTQEKSCLEHNDKCTESSATQQVLLSVMITLVFTIYLFIVVVVVIVIIVVVVVIAIIVIILMSYSYGYYYYDYYYH